MLNERIREARNSAGMSQRQLAAAIGASPRSVSLWETTDREPEFKFLERIAGATGKSLDYFRTVESH